MGFNLRSQTPLPDVTKKLTSKQSLNREGKSETRYYRGDVEVSSDEANVLNNRAKQKATQKRQDYERSRPNAVVQSLMDPTGISQWGEAKIAAVDLAKMAGSAIGLKSQQGYNWDSGRATGDVLDIVGAIPLVGKSKIAKEGLKLVKTVAKPILPKAAKLVIGHVATTAAAAANNEYNKSKKK